MTEDFADAIVYIFSLIGERVSGDIGESESRDWSGGQSRRGLLLSAFPSMRFSTVRDVSVCCVNCHLVEILIH